MTARPDSGPRGVWAAALTPMREDLTADHAMAAAHYAWLLSQGCDGVVTLGTTGEANSFSVEERLELLDALAASDIPGEKLIVGTGCCAIPDTVRLTRKALDLGASGCLMLPPFYYKKVSEDGLFAAYAETIERVGDERLRIYIYDFPQMTGLDIGIELIRRLIDAYPRTVVGIKDSSGDWPKMERVCRAFPGFGMFAGSEEFLLPVLRAGGPGAISATVNVLARQTAEVYAHRQEPQADGLQAELTKVRRSIQAYPLVPALKAVMARHTGDDRWLNLRPPLTNLRPEQAQALFAGLDDAGFRLAA